MVDPLVVALDVGTSTVRAAIYDGTGTAVDGRFHRVACRPSTTPDGGVEHDPEQLLEAAATCLDAIQAGTRAPIAAVGVCTFWHGLLGFQHTATDIVRALLEAVALRVALVYDLLAPFAASEHRIIASGGALARSPAWAQMIADAIGRPLSRSRESEATSRGAARLALHALGALAEIGAAPAPLGDTIEPDPARHARYQEMRARQLALDDRI
jgi:sugar (pentulose or hexulose) kinase